MMVKGIGQHHLIHQAGPMEHVGVAQAGSNVRTRNAPYQFPRTREKVFGPTSKLSKKLLLFNRQAYFLDELFCEHFGACLSPLKRSDRRRPKRSEERRVGKECRSGWAPDH